MDDHHDTRGMAQAIRLVAADLDVAEAMLRTYLARAWNEGFAVEAGDTPPENPYVSDSEYVFRLAANG